MIIKYASDVKAPDHSFPLTCYGFSLVCWTTLGDRNQIYHRRRGWGADDEGRIEIDLRTVSEIDIKKRVRIVPHPFFGYLLKSLAGYVQLLTF